MIAVNKFWLFKTKILDPFIFNTTDGVDVTMSGEKSIDDLCIHNVEFFFDNVVNGTFSWQVRYGGEDVGATVSTGKNEMKYKLMWNMPNFSIEVIERIVGGEWSAVIETIGGDRLVTFARFQAENYDFQSDQLNEMELEGELTSARIYTVNSLGILNIENVIDREFICSQINNRNFIPIT